MQVLPRRKPLRLTALCLTILALAPAAAVAFKEKSPQDRSEGAALFNRHCAKCHSRDGTAHRLRGTVLGARNLTNARWQDEVTDQEIAAAIRKGPGPMPSFESKLSDEEISTLVAYVRHFRKERRPSTR
ncbi:MAG: c-type cytochrome [Armatimonadota bacterium]